MAGGAGCWLAALQNETEKPRIEIITHREVPKIGKSIS
jgi:hypothetical protein